MSALSPITVAVRAAQRRLFGTVFPAQNLRSGRKILRKPLIGSTVDGYWPTTVEWHKFPEYAWEDLEHYEEAKSIAERSGSTLGRKRGAGKKRK